MPIRVVPLIEPLYQAGVRTLGWEFTRSRFNGEIAQLVTADEFDDELANQLLRRGPWPTWGYQEYVDILQSAWQLNRNLPPDAPPFRVIALDSEWSQYELWFGGLSQAQLFQTIVDREQHMTRVLMAETFEKNEKALVHIGYATHADPTRIAARQSVGRQIWITRQASRSSSGLESSGRHGALSATCLIGWPRGRAQAARLALTSCPSPWGRLTDSSAGAFRFAAPGGTLADVAQGYVFLKPLKGLESVTWIPGFIVEENFKQARAIATRMKWIDEAAVMTSDELDAALGRRFRREADGDSPHR